MPCMTLTALNYFLCNDEAMDYQVKNEEKSTQFQLQDYYDEKQTTIELFGNSGSSTAPDEDLISEYSSSSYSSQSLLDDGDDYSSEISNVDNTVLSGNISKYSSLASKSLLGNGDNFSAESSNNGSAAVSNDIISEYSSSSHVSKSLLGNGKKCSSERRNNCSTAVSNDLVSKYSSSRHATRILLEGDHDEDTSGNSCNDTSIDLSSTHSSSFSYKARIVECYDYGDETSVAEESKTFDYSRENYQDSIDDETFGSSKFSRII